MMNRFLAKLNIFRTRDGRSFLAAAFCPLPSACCLLLAAFCLLPSAAGAQVLVDKTVATVTTGARAIPDVITYSDLAWQLALEPNTPLVDKPSSAELNRALHLLEDQLLIVQEARKLPGADPSATEVKERQKELAQMFGGGTRLQERMTRVGLTAEQLDAILADRIRVERYLDFRFRAFVVITQKETTARYNEKYGRERNSGKIVPTLDSVRSEIEQELTSEKIETEIDKFVDSLREQPGTEIVILSPV